MKKTLLTMSFLALTFHVGFAGNNPFEKAANQSKVKEKVQGQQMKMMPFLGQLENQRTASFTPDSMTMYDHDGTAWELSATAKITYNGSGDYSSILFFIPPPLSLPFMRVDITYNAAGKLTRFEQTQLFPAPSTMFKLEQRFDANNNLISMKVYEDDNGTLELIEGDSVIYDYAGTTINGITTSFYDDFTSMWQNYARVQGMQYNANGEPTALDYLGWDDQSGAWATVISRYTSLSWGFGYSGILDAFGIEEVVSDDFLSVLPIASYEEMNEPTDYLSLVVVGAAVDTMERSSSTRSGALITQVLYEEYFAGTWEPSNRTSYMYDANSRMLSATAENHNGTAWENSFRDTWEYNSQGHLTENMGEYASSGSWVVSYGSEYVYQYTTANIPFDIITNEYDFNTSSFQPEQRMVFNFGGFSTSVPDFSIQSIAAYPNPVVNQLNIRVDLAKTELLTIEVMNIAGQLVYSDRVMANAGVSQQVVSFDAFDQGIYFVRVGTSENTKVIRIVK